MPPSENGETPKYNLPPPVIEAGSENGVSTVEQAPASPETARNPVSSAPSNSTTQPTSVKLDDFSAAAPQAVVATTSLSDNPQIAEDNDLIEKEWVDKAKKIIESNREDPYNQSKEITSFKADYMKKRYNKEIKVSD